MNSDYIIAATLFTRDMVGLRNVSINTMHNGGGGGGDDDDDNNNNNNNVTTDFQKYPLWTKNLHRFVIIVVGLLFHPLLF